MNIYLTFKTHGGFSHQALELNPVKIFIAAATLLAKNTSTQWGKS